MDTGLDCTQAFGFGKLVVSETIHYPNKAWRSIQFNYSPLEKDLHAHPLIIGLLPTCNEHVDFLWWPLVLPSGGIISGPSSFLRNSKWIHMQFRHRVNSQWSLLPKPMATFNPYCRHIICLLTQQTPFEFVTCVYYWLSLMWTTGNQLWERADVILNFFFSLCIFLHFSFLLPYSLLSPHICITCIFKKQTLKS